MTGAPAEPSSRMNWLIWLRFFAIFIGVLALDLGVLHRESRTMHVRQALGWTVVWVIVALSFSGLVYGVYEHHWFGWRAFRRTRPTAPKPRSSSSPATCSNGRCRSTTSSSSPSSSRT